MFWIYFCNFEQNRNNFERKKKFSMIGKYKVNEIVIRRQIIDANRTVLKFDKK